MAHSLEAITAFRPRIKRLPLAEGRAVNTGTVTYVPNVDLDGSINVRVRVDKHILRALNAEGRFRGRFTNAENVGKNQDELVAMWNEAHPDDPVEG